MKMNIARKQSLADQRAMLWLRALVAIAGGYLFSWGLCALSAQLLVFAGMVRSEVVALFSMLAFLIYLLAAMWAVATRRLWRTAGLLTGGGVLMTLLARLLAGVV